MNPEKAPQSPTSSPVPGAPALPGEKSDPMSPKKKVLLIALGVICSIFVLKYGVYRFFHETTDNAYITGHVHYIASQVSGVVQTVAVENNTPVKAGDLLIQIDPAPFDAALADAVAKNEKASGDYDRQQGLANTRVVSVQDLAHAKDDANSAAAQLRMAQINRKYATIVSPVDGIVGGRSVEAGNSVIPSINLLAIVEGNPWVEANFKETQVAHIHKGQEVSLTVDAIPGHEFKGRVVSVAPASGRQFALLPADNATGNFTKIVQRLPVRIEFEKESVKGCEDRIVPGLSVVASIKVR